MSEDKKQEPAERWLTEEEWAYIWESGTVDMMRHHLNVLLTDKANGATSLAEFADQIRAEERKEIMEVSLCCYPNREEADFTYKNSWGGDVEFTLPMTAKIMDDVATVIGPCVYYDAKHKDHLTAKDERIAELEQERKTSRDRLAYIDKEIKDGMNSAGWLETSLRGIRTRIAEWIKETDA